MREKYFYIAAFFCLIVITLSAVFDSYNFYQYLDRNSQFVEVGEVTINPDLK